MSEQQMANYTLTIVADSGYESTTEGRCTADQYGDAISALHGTAPQRQWVGMTEEEVEACFHHVDHAGIGLFDFAEAIEAKLKEKNT